MRLIAITNQKGGSAKTTTAVNLAGALAKNKRMVLLIDLDPQASASEWFSITGTDKGLFRILTDNIGDLLDIVTPTRVPGIDIIPASPWLIGIDAALSHEVGRESILRKKTGALPKNRWDYILFDCSPSLGIMTINALTASAEILVPVETHSMALAGLTHLIKTVSLVRKRLNAALRISGIVACRVNRTRHAREILGHIRDNFGELVYKTVVRENIRLAEASSQKRPITEYAPDSTGARDYLSLAHEVIHQKG